MKSEFGPQALVLNSKQTKRSWFQKPVFEVTAALKAERPKSAPAFAAGELEKIFPHRLEERTPPPAAKKPASRYFEANAVPRTTAVREEKAFLLAGISPERAKELERRYIFDVAKHDREDPRAASDARVRLLASDMKCFPQNRFDSTRAWSLVGPAGSGKTTLAVKLALALKGRGRTVTLVAGDRRKISARQELQSYAKLIRVPVESEFKTADGMILVDTPALEQETTSQVQNLCHGTQALLVLDASWRVRELLRAVEQAERLPVAAVAFTRFDGVREPGAVYEVLKTTRLACLGASLSSSFRVPFAAMESREIAAWILGLSTTEDVPGGNA